MHVLRCLGLAVVAALALPFGAASASTTIGASPHGADARDTDLRLAYYPPASRTIKCESKKGRSSYCRTGVRGPVRLQRQLSGTPCVEYDNWGSDPDGGGVWVWDGCRATFLVGGGWGPPPPSGGWRPPPGEGGATVTCKSNDFGYNHCPLGRRRSVRLEKNLSDTRCIRGDNWDVDRRGIWVDRGCAARFRVN